MLESGLAGTAARLAIALGIGLLLGAERERRMAQEPHRGSAGIRTFALVALLGGIADRVGGTPVVAVALALVGAAALLGYARSDREERGLTSEVALLVAFLLGVLAQDEPAIASALAVAVTILLSARTSLHRFVASVLTDTEVHDALLFAAAAVVVLPLLPDRRVGPFDVLNPFAVWRLVVLLMAISGAGYVATRAIGPRFGLPVAGLFGGFISSAATVGSMGGVARREPGLLRPAISAALLSSVATMVQMAVVVGVTSAPALDVVAAPLVAAGTGALAYAALATLRLRAGEVASRPHAGHAFQLHSAVLLALVITGVTVAGAVAAEAFGARGVAVAAFVAGLADAHSAAIAVASLVAAGRVAPSAAALPILLALTSNTVSKLAFAYAAGGRRFAVPVGVGLTVVIALAWGGLALR